MKTNHLLSPLLLTLALLAGAATSATEGDPATPNAASEGRGHGARAGFPSYVELDHFLRGEAKPQWSKDARWSYFDPRPGMPAGGGCSDYPCNRGDHAGCQSLRFINPSLKCSGCSAGFVEGTCKP